MKIFETLKTFRRALIWSCKHFPSRNSFGSCGINTVIEGPCHVESPESVFIENNVYLRNNLHIINAPYETVTIKKYTVIAGGVTIVTNNHISIVGIPQILLVASHINDTSKDVIIDEDVWIGTNSTLLAGVHLGRGCIVAAGALVAKSVPPYALVIGSPAKIVKSKFTIEQIMRHEEVLYPPNERMKKDALEKLFANYFEGKGVYGEEKVLSDKDHIEIEKAEDMFDYIHWKS
jgi:acetyltransferase-like isoleucine patch superfamily enzyme